MGEVEQWVSPPQGVEELNFCGSIVMTFSGLAS